jgi:predicted transcriptional regulator with HTH domain
MTLSNRIIVATETDLLDIVRAENRHRDASILRQAVVYAMLQKGVNLSEISRQIHRDRQSVRHAIECHDHDIVYSPPYRVIYDALCRTLPLLESYPHP